MKKNNYEKGFTLVELLVVIAIIVILATIVIVSLNSARMKARDARRVADLDTIRTALEMYMDDYGSYPPGPNSSTWTWLQTNCGTSVACSTFSSAINSYLPSIPQDPKNTDWFHYQIFYPSDNKYILRVPVENPKNANDTTAGNYYYLRSP